jgi:cyanophycinase
MRERAETRNAISRPDMVRSAGPVMAIGGAEDKLRDKLILSAFVNLSGGPDARLAIVPAASSFEDAGERYKALFLGMGAKRADVLYLPDRAAASSPEAVALLDDVTGIFLTGGNQLRLASIVAGTPLARKVKARNRAGAVVAGTSAGASILSSHMVAFGASGPSPRLRMAQMTAGFDLIPGVVIDQHFRQRDRFGRLLALVAGSPSLLGIGVDEDTAAVFSDDIMEVLGRNSVTIVDGTNIVSDIHRVKGHGAITVSGAVVHVLSAGNRFDLIERRFLPQEPVIKADGKKRVATLRSSSRAESLQRLAGDSSD